MSNANSHLEGGYPVATKGEHGGTYVVPLSARAGSTVYFDVADQSTSRTRIEIPSGARAISIFYSATITGATVRKATGVALKAVFNVAGTTEAGNALAESASAAGSTVSGVSYRRIPIDTAYAKDFPDDDDLLYYVDFLTAVAESGGAGSSNVIVEVTLA